MAEASTAQAVEGVRREAEMSFQDAEANHQSQIRDAQAQLEDLVAKLAARDSTILVSVTHLHALLLYLLHVLVTCEM